MYRPLGIPQRYNPPTLSQLSLLLINTSNFIFNTSKLQSFQINMNSFLKTMILASAMYKTEATCSIYSDVYVRGLDAVATVPGSVDTMDGCYSYYEPTDDPDDTSFYYTKNDVKSDGPAIYQSKWGADSDVDGVSITGRLTWVLAYFEYKSWGDNGLEPASESVIFSVEDGYTSYGSPGDSPVYYLNNVYDVKSSTGLHEEADGVTVECGCNYNYVAPDSDDDSFVAPESDDDSFVAPDSDDDSGFESKGYIGGGDGSNNDGGSSSSSTSTGAVVGGSIASIGILSVIIGLLVKHRNRKRKQNAIKRVTPKEENVRRSKMGMSAKSSKSITVEVGDVEIGSDAC